MQGREENNFATVAVSSQTNWQINHIGLKEKELGKN